jgi:hypothetical protein
VWVVWGWRTPHYGFGSPVGGLERLVGCPASVLQLHPHVTVVVDEAAATQLANAEFYRYALKSRPGQQKQEADAGRRGEAHRRAQRTLRIFAVGKYQNSRSPLLMATRRPRHSLGVSGKTEVAPRLNRIVHRTVELDSDAT